jgi:chondroitin-sulfate-ABC endolyase/exolyase
MTMSSCRNNPVEYNSEMAPFEIEQLNKGPFKVYSFGEMPQEFTAGSGSKLELSNAFYRTEKNIVDGSSLCWNWDKPGASISLTDPDAFRYLTGKNWKKEFNWETVNKLSALTFWIYAEKPQDKELKFSIGKGKRVDCQFSLSLNFSGWYRFAALYGRDMQGFPLPDADTLTITTSGKAGKVWIDLLRTNEKIDSRQVRPTKQAPWIYAATSFKDNYQWKPEIPERLSPEIIKEMQNISQKYLMRYKGNFNQRKLTDKQLNELRKRFSAWKIKRTGKAISGRSVARKGVARYWREATALAAAYYCDPRTEVKKELKNMFFDMCDHFVSLGGGGKHIAGYGIREVYCRPLVWMKKELQKESKFKPLLECFRKALGVNGFYKLYPRFNADTANTELQARLGIMLASDDVKQKYADLMALQRWLTLSAEGYGEIKPDGCFFHHNQPYSGYVIPAMNPLVECIALLNGSIFESRAMYKITRKFLWNMHFFTDFDAWPFFFTGRWPSREARIKSLVKDYAIMAKLTNPDTGANFDPQMAAIYMYYAAVYNANPMKDKIYAEFANRGIKPDKPEGNLALPYAVADFHRRDKWLAAVRGQRKDFLSYECYSSFGWESALARYTNYGILLLVTRGEGKYPVSQSAMGLVFDNGWNWNYLPGTTARVLPPENLVTRFVVEEGAPHDENFALGCSLDNNGIFGLKLHETIPTRTGPPRSWYGEKEFERLIEQAGYDESFRANKSYFLFDNRIVALGSGIVNDDSDHKTVTTLFQHILKPEEQEHFVCSDPNGKKVFPVSIAVQGEAIIVDKNNNGYYIPIGNDALQIVRGNNPGAKAVRKAPFYKKTKGATELVYFDHGTDPDNKSYEYCVVIGADTRKMIDFTEAQQASQAYYRVLQKDQIAHVLHDCKSDTTGYVAFEKTEKLPGPLYAVSRPSLVMLRKTSNDKLRMSAAAPDFGPGFGNDSFLREYKDFPLMDGEYMDSLYPQGVKLTVAIRGKWRPAEFNNNIQFRRISMLPDGSFVSLFDIHCRNGISEKITLGQ